MSSRTPAASSHFDGFKFECTLRVCDRSHILFFSFSFHSNYVSRCLNECERAHLGLPHWTFLSSSSLIRLMTFVRNLQEISLHFNAQCAFILRRFNFFSVFGVTSTTKNHFSFSIRRDNVIFV